MDNLTTTLFLEHVPLRTPAPANTKEPNHLKRRYPAVVLCSIPEHVYVHGSQVKNTCSCHVFTHNFVLLVVNAFSPFPLRRSLLQRPSLSFYVALRRDLKFPMRLFEPLLF
jgi:hypothetical protein